MPTAHEATPEPDAQGTVDSNRTRNARVGDLAFPQGFERLWYCGSGGMGIVYAAHDKRLNRLVAVKLLKNDVPTDPFARRFQQETRIAAGLQHPGIVPVYEAGELPDGRPYMVMKLVRGRTPDEKGRTLRDELHERGPDLSSSQERFLPIFESIVRTVAYAHTKDTIHRDLKPSNVMVGEHGEVYVTDWGLGKDQSAPAAGERELTIPGQAIGTPAYMAPEQAKGQRAAATADVFGLGAILCHILTGEPPFRAYEPLMQAAAGDVQDAHARLDQSGGDPELVAIAKRCLDPNPEVRFENAGALARELDKWREALARRMTSCFIDDAKRTARAETESELQRERAEREATERKLRELNLKVAHRQYERAAAGEGLVFETHAVPPNTPGVPELRVLRRGLQIFVPPDALRGEGPLAAVWRCVYDGDIEAALGNYDAARRAYEAAQERANLEFERVQERQSGLVFGDDDGEHDPVFDAECFAAHRVRWISALKLSDLAMWEGKTAEMRAEYSRAKLWLETGKTLYPQRSDCIRDYVVCCTIPAQLAADRAKPAQATKAYQELRELLKEFPDLAREAAFVREQLDALQEKVPITTTPRREQHGYNVSAD